MSDPIHYSVFAALFIGGVEVSAKRIPCEMIINADDESIRLDRDIFFAAPRHGLASIEFFLSENGGEPQAWQDIGHPQQGVSAGDIVSLTRIESGHTHRSM